MREIERLQKQWHESARHKGVFASMRLEKDALVLGAGTVLANRRNDGALALDGQDAKILTLLSVAHGSPVNTSVLRSVRRASQCAEAGDESLASMHVALGLPVLRKPSEAARRLFIADGLLKEGVAPRDIWRALEFDPTPLDELEKYNPDQPRVPAGNGRTSGQWASGGSSSVAEELPAAAAVRAARQIVTQTLGETSPEAKELLETTPDWIEWLEPALRFAPPITFLTTLLHSTPAGGKHHEGPVIGRPDLRYSWNEDETQLYVTRISDGQIVLQAMSGPKGLFYSKKKSIARLFGEHLLVDPAALPPEDPRSTQRDDNRPRQCPEPPLLDKPQGSERSKAYVLYAKTLVNKPPTPPKLGYQLPNPFSAGDIVYYDDCQRSTGAMIEYKGPGYADQLVNKYYSDEFRKTVTEEWLDEATRQIEASGGRTVKWYFAEQGALDFARELFDAHPILRRIQLVYAPPPEDWEWK